MSCSEKDCNGQCEPNAVDGGKAWWADDGRVITAFENDPFKIREGRTGERSFEQRVEERVMQLRIEQEAQKRFQQRYADRGNVANGEAYDSAQEAKERPTMSLAEIAAGFQGYVKRTEAEGNEPISFFAWLDQQGLAGPER